MTNNLGSVNTLEVAAFNAWPAARQLLIDGFLLRFAAGYTKRANSVNRLYDVPFDPASFIDRCEAIYRAQSLPPIFRMVAPDAETEPYLGGAQPDESIGDTDAIHRLDAALAARGYTVLDRTLVMVRAIQHEDTDHASPYICRGMSTTLYPPTLCTLEIAAWLPIYARFSGVDFQTQTGHAAILHQIMLESLPAVLTVEDAPVACGMGVLDGDYFGLFDLVTDPAQRRRGYGARLVQAMLAWAAARNAQIAYLQVVEENHTARALYSRAGFTPRYRYWYRIPRAA